MEKITSRAILGMLQQEMSIAKAPAWVDAISNKFTSDQAAEEYAWLGMAPAMREWVGQRHAKTLPEFNWTITNKDFEATLEFLVKDLRRDKLNAIQTRINELAERAATHEASLLSALIVAGESTVCYDGQYFFDTDHVEAGNVTNQSNDIAITLSQTPVATHGIAAAPAVAEFQHCIAKTIEKIAGFVDDQGEPMNENATSFLVMVPMTFMNSAIQAVTTKAQLAETQTVLEGLGRKFSIEVVPNVRLSSWTTKFATFRTDSAVKPLIRQQETVVNVGAKAEGSEFEFDNKAHQYGIDVSRAVAYGRWQYACLCTMS